MKILQLVFALSLACLASAGDQRVKPRLASVRLARLDFQSTTLREATEALASLVTKTGQTNPNFVLAVPAAVANRRITFKRDSADSLDAISSVAALAGCEVQLERFGTVIREKGAPPLPPIRVEKGVENYRARMESVVFPKVDFRETTLREAVEFVAAKSKSIFPEGEGMNLVLKLDDVDGAAPSVPLPATVTFSATDLPYLEACRYIAGPLGLDVSFERYGVSIVRLNAKAGDIKTPRPAAKK